MSRIAVVGNSNTYLQRFRMELLETLRQAGHDVIVLCPTDGYLQTPWNSEIRRIDLSLAQHSVNPWTEAHTVLALARAIKHLKPDMIINFTIKPSIYGSFAASVTGVKRTVSVFTGLGHLFTDGARRNSLVAGSVQLALRFALRRNERVFFQNEDDRRLFIKQRLVPEELTRVVDGSGIDAVHFSPRPNRQERPTFLLVGRMLPEKGVVEFVAAARELRRRFANARFWLLGPIDTSPSAISANTIESWAAEGAIEYLGEVADVRALIAEASVVVLPSYREGTPRAVLEGMAMGKPIVTTDVPGCRETVVDGISGLLVPARNVPALVSALERFVVDPTLIERLGAQSRRIVLERYEVHKVNHAFLHELGLCAPD